MAGPGPLDIVIAGGSAAGLFAALLPARAGHYALVLERDSLHPAPDVEPAAASAFRPSAPQIVQPHIVMARCRQLLLERLPDVYAGLLAAGVAEAPLRTQMPDSLFPAVAGHGRGEVPLLVGAAAASLRQKGRPWPSPGRTALPSPR